MERITDIEQKVQNHKSSLPLNYYDGRDIPEFMDDIEYLLAENKRLREALEQVVNAPSREHMRKYAEEALKQE